MSDPETYMECVDDPGISTDTGDLLIAQCEKLAIRCSTLVQERDEAQAKLAAVLAKFPEVA